MTEGASDLITLTMVTKLAGRARGQADLLVEQTTEHPSVSGEPARLLEGIGLLRQPALLTSSPASTPMRIACAELATFSLASRSARCIFTVFSSMPRKPAICLLR